MGRTWIPELLGEADHVGRLAVDLSPGTVRREGSALTLQGPVPPVPGLLLQEISGCTRSPPGEGRAAWLLGVSPRRTARAARQPPAALAEGRQMQGARTSKECGERCPAWARVQALPAEGAPLLLRTTRVGLHLGGTEGEGTLFPWASVERVLCPSPPSPFPETPGVCDLRCLSNTTPHQGQRAGRSYVTR